MGIVGVVGVMVMVVVVKKGRGGDDRMALKKPRTRLTVIACQ